MDPDDPAARAGERADPLAARSGAARVTTLDVLDPDYRDVLRAMERRPPEQ
jgi:hypothetical protein